VLVAPSGLEPERCFQRGILGSTAGGVTKHESANTEESDTRSDTEKHERPPDSPRVATETDPVEFAIATALDRASAAGEWQVVLALAKELEARRNHRQIL